jgi:hypothetical protein
VKEVENATNAVLEFATNMTARKNDVRSGGDKMATPGHKGGKGKEERDLDDTSSSSDDNDDDDDSSLESSLDSSPCPSTRVVPRFVPRLFSLFVPPKSEKTKKKKKKNKIAVVESLQREPEEGPHQTREPAKREIEKGKTVQITTLLDTLPDSHNDVIVEIEDPRSGFMSQFFCEPSCKVSECKPRNREDSPPQRSHTRFCV